MADPTDGQSYTDCPSHTDCSSYTDAASARLDGEDPGVVPEVLDAHLRDCPRCRSFVESAEDLRRRAGVARREPVPDNGAAILDAIAVGAAPRAPVMLAGRPVRGQRLIAAAAAVVVVVLGAFVGGERLAGSGSRPAVTGVARVQQVSGSTQASPNYPGATVLPPGKAVLKPALTLTDTSGAPYDVARETAGKVTLVYFGYTHCPDVCPINMALTSEALARMPAQERQKVTVLFVTTDPARDTPAVMRAWLDRINPSFIGLTGTEAQIHQAETAVGMPLSYAETASSADGGYTIVHAGYTLLYSQDGLANLQVDVTEQLSQYATTLDHLVTHGFQAA